MTGADFVARLAGVRGHGPHWMARCPVHDDDRASLSVDETADGTLLVHCHANCATATVVAEMGLAMTDLQRPQAGKGGERASIAYSYVDESGHPLFETVRFTNPKDFRQRRPDGAWTLEGVRRVLYRLPSVMAAAESGGRVFVVEGEKDADRLAGAGLTATTAPMGAGKWRPEYADALRGADVIVLPDNDEPGRAHAAAVVASLASARIVLLDGLPDKGDVSDWLDSGHTIGDLMAACEPTSTALAIVTRATAERIGRANLAPIDAVATHLPTWNDACRGRGGREGLARMWHCVIAAASNKGKTLFALNLVDAALAAGRAVLYVLLEGAQVDIMPKLYALSAGAPISELEPGRRYQRERWAAVTEQFHARNDAAGSWLAFAEHTGRQLPAIVSAIHDAAARGATLVVIDYLQLIRVPNTTDIFESTTRLSGDLCETAVRENVTTLAHSQFNRGALNDKSKGMTIHGLSGGGPLENDADQVLLLDHTKAKIQGAVTASTVLLAKNRQGPAVDFGVEWDWRSLRVREPALLQSGRYDV